MRDLICSTVYARVSLRLALLALAIATGNGQPAAGDDARRGRVHNLKVLSDQIDDVTTAENILRSFLEPQMTAAQRSEALWRAAVKYRHQTIPPNEFLAADWEAHDPPGRSPAGWQPNRGLMRTKRARRWA